MIYGNANMGDDLEEFLPVLSSFLFIHSYIIFVPKTKEVVKE
jgi:hypothetical protein